MCGRCLKASSEGVRDFLGRPAYRNNNTACSQTRILELFNRLCIFSLLSDFSVGKMKQIKSCHKTNHVWVQIVFEQKKCFGESMCMCAALRAYHFKWKILAMNRNHLMNNGCFLLIYCIGNCQIILSWWVVFFCTD